MKILMFVILTLWQFLPVLGYTDSEQKLTINNEIPPQIYKYYKDYNFVSSFSSESERSLLTSFLSSKELPAHLKSERLRKIYKLMKNLKMQVMRIDPQIVVPLIPPLNQNIIQPELIKINGVQRHDNEARIEVLVYAIDQGTNLKLISVYDTYGGNERKIPSEEQRIQMSISKFAPRKEIHKWILINGKWLKQEANTLLLKDSR